MRPLTHELERVIRSGGTAQYELATAEHLHALEPALSYSVNGGVLLHGQRYLDPPEYLRCLADAVRTRGGAILEGYSVSQVPCTAADTVTGQPTKPWLENLGPLR